MTDKQCHKLEPPSKLLPLFALLLKETKILQKKLIHQNPTFLSLSLEILAIQSRSDKPKNMHVGGGGCLKKKKEF